MSACCCLSAVVCLKAALLIISLHTLVTKCLLLLLISVICVYYGLICLFISTHQSQHPFTAYTMCIPYITYHYAGLRVVLCLLCCTDKGTKDTLERPPSTSFSVACSIIPYNALPLSCFDCWLALRTLVAIVGYQLCLSLVAIGCGQERVVSDLLCQLWVGGVPICSCGFLKVLCTVQSDALGNTLCLFTGNVVDASTTIALHFYVPCNNVFLVAHFLLLLLFRRLA